MNGQQRPRYRAAGVSSSIEYVVVHEWFDPVLQKRRRMWFTTSESEGLGIARLTNLSAQATVFTRDDADTVVGVFAFSHAKAGASVRRLIAKAGS